MMHPIFILLLSISPIFVWAQDNPLALSTFYVTGDHVNVREDTVLSSHVVFQVNWGTQMKLERMSSNWYRYVDEYGPRILYIHGDYVARYNEFISKAKQLKKMSGAVKLAMMRYYQKKGEEHLAWKYYQALILFHTREDHPYATENCSFLGERAFYHFVRHAKQNKKERIRKTLELDPDRMIESLAILERGKLQIEENELEAAEATFWQLWKMYADFLFIPLPCDYDAENKLYPIRDWQEHFMRLIKQRDPDHQLFIQGRLKQLLPSVSGQQLQMGEALEREIDAYLSTKK